MFYLLYLSEKNYTIVMHTCRSDAVETAKHNFVKLFNHHWSLYRGRIQNYEIAFQWRR